MALDWVEEMIGNKLDYSGGSGIKDSLEFGAILKDGSVLCQYVSVINYLFINVIYYIYICAIYILSIVILLKYRLINRLNPGSVKKINTMKAPFKQVRLRCIYNRGVLGGG